MVLLDKALLEAGLIIVNSHLVEFLITISDFLANLLHYNDSIFFFQVIHGADWEIV